MSWRIEWTNRALRDVERLDRRERERVFRAVDRIAETKHGDLRLLQGQRDTWRLRVGELRVILELDRTNNLTRLERVLPRGRAYRR